jgi:type VI secretion system FHA domain protein
MVLTLEILTAGAGMVEAGTRQVFQVDGGTIGRRPDCTWVLPDSAVSSVHARIICRDGVFSVTDDHSTNGVFVNSEQDLERGVPHELRSGDTVYIGPYEIGVTIPSNDVRDDPFASASLHVPAPARRPALEPADGPQPLAELDPLKALELDRKPDNVDPVHPVPEESRLHARSPLEDH